MPAAKKTTPPRAPSAHGKVLASIVQSVENLAKTTAQLVENDQTLAESDARIESKVSKLALRVNIFCGIVGFAGVAAMAPKISSAIALGQAIAGAILHTAQGHPIAP